MRSRRRCLLVLIGVCLLLAQVFFLMHPSSEAVPEEASHPRRALIPANLTVVHSRPPAEVVVKAVANPMARAPADCLYVHQPGCSHVRVQEQLDFVPKGFQYGPALKKKTILLYNGRSGWEQPVYGPESIFKAKKCRVDNCELVFDDNQQHSADAVIFRNGFHGGGARPAHQAWIIYLLESPYHASIASGVTFNWTATYRLDSTVVTPYGWWRPLSAPAPPAKRNYAQGKTKLVAWFVSNCNAANGRQNLVRELQQHIPVDVYGACGTMQCPRGSGACSKMLNEDYKFYLSFENSNCRDYATEKYFETGLGHDVVPIVMGPPREDYERMSPPHSFIHVEDFPDVKQLAEFLVKLNASDDLYNEYFSWKGRYVSDDTKFWCRVCALLNDESGKPWQVHNFHDWWNGPNVCIGAARWSDVLKKGRK